MNFFHFREEPFYLLFFGIAIILIINLTSCASQPIPALDVKTWAGDSAHYGITRSQDDETIYCEDPEFDEYACMSYSDIKKIYATLLQCQKWGPPIATRSQLKKMYRENREVITHVLESE